MPVFKQKAKENNSPITFADQHNTAHLASTSLEHSYFNISKDGILHLENLEVNLHGAYQTKNLLTAISAIEQLQNIGLALSEPEIRAGFSNIKSLSNFIGRWQILGHSPLIIADSAHNEAGIRQVVEQLERLSPHHLHFVWGTVNDKDLSKVLPLLPNSATYYFAKANIPRGLDAKALKEKAKPFGLNGRAYVSVKNALNAAKRKAQPGDLIFIGGSIFVVGEVLG